MARLGDKLRATAWLLGIPSALLASCTSLVLSSESSRPLVGLEVWPLVFLACLLAPVAGVFGVSPIGPVPSTPLWVLVGAAALACLVLQFVLPAPWDVRARRMMAALWICSGWPFLVNAT